MEPWRPCMISLVYVTQGLFIKSPDHLSMKLFFKADFNKCKAELNISSPWVQCYHVEVVFNNLCRKAVSLDQPSVY